MRYLLLPLLVVVGCTGSSNPCARVKCSAGKTCNPLNGLCVKGDGGEELDAGSDAGEIDAGAQDAGELDAGVTDGGSDAGTACASMCPMGQYCNTATGACVGCLQHSHCTCPDNFCDQGTCRRLVEDGGNTPPPASAETCATASPFSLFGCDLPRSVSFRADLGGKNDDERGVCSVAAGMGRDLVYVLRLDGTYDVDVSVTPAPGSTSSPVVYVRSMPCAGRELACESNALGASTHLRSRPKGDYAIFVDSYQASAAGPVDVTLTLSAPTLPTNETCLTAEPISTDGGVVRIDLSTASNDEGLSCNTGGIGSRDVVWTFELDATTDILARATAVTPGVSPLIELRSSCSPADQIRCRSGIGGSAQVLERQLDPGTYYLFVESWDGGSAGLVDVSVTTNAPQPALNDDCTAPLDIVFADGGTFTEFDVDTLAASDDIDGDCSVAGSVEYVYRLRLLDPRRVVITAAPGAPGVDPVLYVRANSCTSPAAELDCLDDLFSAAVVETFTTGTSTLPPGDYFIFIESYGEGTGPTHVTVSAAP